MPPLRPLVSPTPTLQIYYNIYVLICQVFLQFSLINNMHRHQARAYTPTRVKRVKTAICGAEITTKKPEKKLDLFS